MASDQEEEIARLRGEIARLERRLADGVSERPVAGAPLYATLVEEGVDALFVAASDGRFVYVNDSATRMLGYRRDELCAMSMTDVVDPADLAATPLRIDELREGRMVETERRLRRKDGTFVPVEIRGRMLDHCYVAFVRDRSARVAFEQAQRESQQLLEELGANLPSLVWVGDAVTGALQFASPGWSRLLGKAPELCARVEQLFACAHPDDQERLLATITASDPTFDDIVRMVDVEGNVGRFHVRVVGIRAPGGRLYRVLGVADDVSSAQAALDALHASEAKYRNLFERAPVGIFRARTDNTDHFEVNARLCEIFGLTREEVVARPLPTWWSDPAQREAMHRQLRERGRVDDFEAKLIVGGDDVHVLASLTLYPDGVYEGSIVDITERKRTERALRDSEARYRSVVDAMTDAIVLYGPDGAIDAANAAAEQIVELASEPLTSRTPPDLRWRTVREDGSPFPREELPGWVTLRTGEPCTGVVIGAHRPTGELSWFSVNSRRVTPLGQDGAHSVVASFRDITEKRRADEELHASLREKDVLLKEIHHRVKNNLQIVTSLLYLQSTMRPSDTRLGDLLRESRDRIASMSLVHQQLYEAGNLSRIPFEQYVRDLAQSLYESYGVAPDRIALRVSAEKVMLSIDVAVPCALLLNEVLSNALKHAFPGGASGSIAVSIVRVNTRCRLRIVDDGVGLPHDLEARMSASLGMKLIAQLTEQLDGTLSRNSDERGTAYEIEFDCGPG